MTALESDIVAVLGVRMGRREARRRVAAWRERTTPAVRAWAANLSLPELARRIG